MSDQEVSLALDDLERLLGQGEAPDPDALAQWQGRFAASLAQAERGEGWAALVARAKELALRLEARALALTAEREALRRELDLQAQGARALKGYRPG